MPVVQDGDGRAIVDIVDAEVVTPITYVRLLAVGLVPVVVVPVRVLTPSYVHAVAFKRVATPSKLTEVA